MLDVTVKDPQGIQVFGESKTFNMVGYTQSNQQGEATLDNWLIRSWQDNAVQPGRTTHVFSVSVPTGTSAIDVEASLTYQVGASISPMSEVSQRFTLNR